MSRVPIADQIRVHHDPAFPKVPQDSSETKSVAKEPPVSQGTGMLAPAKPTGALAPPNSAPLPRSPIPLSAISSTPIALINYSRPQAVWPALCAQLTVSDRLALAQAILGNSFKWAASPEGHGYWADHNARIEMTAMILKQAGL